MSNSPSVAIIDDMAVGMIETYDQTITDADIKASASLSDDNDPVHISEEYADNSRFKERIAHRMLSASYFQPCLVSLYVRIDVFIFHRI